VTATESVASAPDPGRAIPFPGRAHARTQRSNASQATKLKGLCSALLA
jgi:hypothetical protein